MTFTIRDATFCSSTIEDYWFQVVRQLTAKSLFFEWYHIMAVLQKSYIDLIQQVYFLVHQRASSVQTSLSQNYLKLDILTTFFLFLVVTLAFLKKAMEIRLRSDFTTFRALLPSANYSAE